MDRRKRIYASLKRFMVDCRLAELGAGMTAEEVAEAESIVEVWYRYIVPRG